MSNGSASPEEQCNITDSEVSPGNDARAMTMLYERFRRPIHSYIYRMLGSLEDADDVTQEVFMRAFAAWNDLYERDNLSAWLYRIATNLAISELRKRKRRRLVSLTGFFQESEGREAREFNPSDSGPLQDAVLVDTERREAVQRAISTLPEKYRAPLVLRDVEGKSYDEIARILETSEGTVKSRISRARGFLREKLRAYL